MKISIYWLIPVIIIAAFATYLFIQYVYIPSETVSVTKRKNYDVITATLPNSRDMDITGPKYWELYHFLDKNIPCYTCRKKAIPLGIFRHDIVNGMNDKKIFPFDKSNWKLWVDKVNELDKKLA